MSEKIQKLGLADIAAYFNGLGTRSGTHHAQIAMQAIALLGDIPKEG